MTAKTWVQEAMDELEACRNGRAPVRGKYQRSVQSQKREPEIPAIDFGNQLLPLAKLSKHTGIGVTALRVLVKRGLLKKHLVPGSKRGLYSTFQLTNILRRHNE